MARSSCTTSTSHTISASIRPSACETPGVRRALSRSADAVDGLAAAHPARWHAGRTGLDRLRGARRAAKSTPVVPIPGTRRPERCAVDTVLFPVRSRAPDLRQRLRRGHAASPGDPRHQSPRVDYYAGTWQGTTAVLGVFIPAGIEHILIGPDHVLFLVGLLLLGGSIGTLVTIVTAFTHRPQHHAVAGRARHRLAAGEHRRAGDRAQHRLRRRGQPAGAERSRRAPQRRDDEAAARYPGVGGGGVRTGARLRLRERAEGVRPADHGARLVAVLVQPRRRDRSAGDRARRRVACLPRCAAGARRRAAGS